MDNRSDIGPLGINPSVEAHARIRHAAALQGQKVLVHETESIGGRFIETYAETER